MNDVVFPESGPAVCGKLRSFYTAALVYAHINNNGARLHLRNQIFADNNRRGSFFGNKSANYYIGFSYLLVHYGAIEGRGKQLCAKVVF